MKTTKTGKHSEEFVKEVDFLFTTADDKAFHMHEYGDWTEITDYLLVRECTYVHCRDARFAVIDPNEDDILVIETAKAVSHMKARSEISEYYKRRIDEQPPFTREKTKLENEMILKMEELEMNFLVSIILV